MSRAALKETQPKGTFAPTLKTNAQERDRQERGEDRTEQKKCFSWASGLSVHLAEMIVPEFGGDEVVNQAIRVHGSGLMALPDGAQGGGIVPVTLKDAIFEKCIQFGAQAAA